MYIWIWQEEKKNYFSTFTLFSYLGLLHPFLMQERFQADLPLFFFLKKNEKSKKGTLTNANNIKIIASVEITQAQWVPLSLYGHSWLTISLWNCVVFCKWCYKLQLILLQGIIIDLLQLVSLYLLWELHCKDFHFFFKFPRGMKNTIIINKLKRKSVCVCFFCNCNYCKWVSGCNFHCQLSQL